MPTYTYTTLDDPSAAEGTFAYGINNSGQIVGYYQDSNLNKLGFVYSGGTFTPFNVAQGINDAGQIVGLSGDGFSSFLYNAGNYTSIYDPSAFSKTLAQGINGGGQVVGWYDTGLGALGFLYSGGNYTTIKDPLGDSTSRPFGFPITVNHTYAHGINDAGQIVGGYQGDSGNNGFLYSGGNYTTLKDPLSVGGTVAEGINNAGQIVGYYLDSSQVAHAFLYSGGTYTTIDDPLGTKGTVAQGINDAGQIVGYYIDSGGNTHGFILTIGPNPPAPAGTSADMILRHGSDGLYQIYDIGNNAILAAYSLGRVGTDWGLSRSAASTAPIRATCCCAIPIPGASRSTTSATTSPGPPSSATSAWTGRSWASAISRASAKTT
jgi:probable HAF family extracellular repeat protein